MRKSTDVLTGWVDVPLPVEIARLSMVVKRKISIIEKSLKIRQILLVFNGVLLKSYLKRETFLHQLT